MGKSITALDIVDLNAAMPNANELLTKEVQLFITKPMSAATAKEHKEFLHDLENGQIVLSSADINTDLSDSYFDNIDISDGITIESTGMDKIDDTYFIGSRLFASGGDLHAAPGSYTTGYSVAKGSTKFDKQGFVDEDFFYEDPHIVEMRLLSLAK